MSHGCLIFIYLPLHLLLVQQRVNGQCGASQPLVLTAGSSPQYFTSPNYPSNYDNDLNCSWRVEAPTVYDKVIINIEDFFSESSTADYMDLYNGSDASSTHVITMDKSNRKTLNAFVSSGNALFFTFVSDSTHTFRGFQILYFHNDTDKQPACDSTLVVTGAQQVLMSSNLPGAYDQSHTCSWTFSSSSVILFQIKFLDMGGCGQNHLRFYDGTSADDSRLDTVCSDAETYEFADVTTTAFSGHVAWTVDTESDNYYGFLLIYRTNSATTTTTPAPDTTTTTTTAPDTTTTTTTAPDTTTTTTAPDTTTTTTAPDTTTTTTAPDTTTTATTTAPDTTTTTSTTTARDTTTTSTTTARDTTTTTPAPDTTTTTRTTTTASTVCNESLTATATAAYFTTENYPNNYPSNTNCHKFITSPANTAITLTFPAFQFEADTYCTYDYFAVYDYSTVDQSTFLIGTYCGTNVPSTLKSSDNGLYIAIYSDNSIQSTGANVSYVYTDNTYPNCKSSYTSYTVTSGTQTISNANNPYLSNQDEYFLIENPTGGNLILQLIYMSIERSSGCIYDRLTIYDGGCTTNTILDIACGSFLKRWELTGYEYLAHFHSDTSIERNGFTLEFSLGVHGTGAPTTTTSTQGPHVSAEVFLINDMLTNYSTENFPVRNLSTSVKATVEVYIAGVNSLDEVQQKLTTTIQFEITWIDEGLNWPSSKMKGITKILLPQNDIWTPDLALLNSFTSLSAMGSKFMFVVVESNGLCTWKPYQILESTCQADMTNYPYDTQECDLKFSTWSSSSDQVQTIIGSGGMRRHENFVENSEWKLEGISQRNETINGQLTAVFTLRLKRNHSFIVFYVTVPVILLSLLNSLTFALPVVAGEKAGYAITVFLSFLIYVIVTFQKMPDSSDTISLFGVYVLIMTGMSSLTVVISLLEIRMMGLKTKNKPALYCIILFTKRILNWQHRLLCIQDEIDEKLYLKAWQNTRRKVAFADDDGDIKRGDKIWPEFISALDFVLFWVFFIVAFLLASCFMIYLATR